MKLALDASKAESCPYYQLAGRVIHEYEYEEIVLVRNRVSEDLLQYV